jgi:hypothetical protein
MHRLKTAQATTLADALAVQASSIEKKTTKLERDLNLTRSDFTHFKTINEPLLDVATKVMRRCIDKIYRPTTNSEVARIGNEAAHHGNILAVLGMLRQAVGSPTAWDVLLFRNAFDIELSQVLGPNGGTELEMLRKSPLRVKIYNMTGTMKSRGSLSMGGASVSRENDALFTQHRDACRRILQRTLASYQTSEEGYAAYEKDAAVVKHVREMAEIVAINYELYKARNSGSSWS